jgi:arylsulfatase A-like enzyme
MGWRQRARVVRAICAMGLVGVTAPSGCGQPGPVVTTARLTALPATVVGEAQRDSSLITSFDAAALATWERVEKDGAVRITSPVFEKGFPDVGTLELELVPGGGELLALIPVVEGDRIKDGANTRRIEVPIERNLAPGTAVRLRIDLAETLHGNWYDTRRSGRLQRLVLQLPNAPQPDAIGIERLVLRRRGDVEGAYAARAAPAEVDGVFHPSWWVRGGAHVDFELEVPADGELRWYDAALGDAERRVTVRVEDDGEEIWRGTGGEGWRARTASLDAFAGQRVVLRLESAGEGVGLFGAPRILGRSDDAPVPKGDFLLYMMDSVRADHVGVFGDAPAGRSPTLDRLAKEGIGFARALSHSSWTKPAIATLLTGILPTTHRVGSKTLSDRLPASVERLPDRFRAGGWRTGSFSANPLGSTLSGLEQGFGTALPPRHWSGRTSLGVHPSGHQLHEALLAWIDEEPEQPFFAYVHVMETHSHGIAAARRAVPPGETPEGAALRAADGHLANLLSELAVRGRTDVTVVVLSDHGDSFGEHGHAYVGHGTSLYQEQIHVPLVIRPPEAPGVGVVDTLAAVSDVAPTLLDLAGLPPLEEAEGRSLRPLLEGGTVEPRSIPSALLRFPHTPDAPQQFSLVRPDGVKRIEIGDGRRLTYDLARDPGELGHPLPPPDAMAEIVRELQARVDAYPEDAAHFAETHGPVEAGALSADELERLRSLGYVR